MYLPRPRDIVSAIPDLGLVGAFLITWISPRTFGIGSAATLMLTMGLEFIVVHSAMFMGNVLVSGGSLARRTLWILGLGVFYSIFFVAGLCAWVHE